MNYTQCSETEKAVSPTDSAQLCFDQRSVLPVPGIEVFDPQVSRVSLITGARRSIEDGSDTTLNAAGSQTHWAGT